MAASKSKILIFAAVPALILLLPLSIYFIDSAAATDRIARNTTVAGIDVGRQSQSEALASLQEHTSALTEHVTRVEINGTVFDLDPSDVGLEFDSTGAVYEALGLRKDGIRDWLRTFTEDLDVPLPASLHPDMLELRLASWEQDAIANPAFEGSITIANGMIRHEFPRSGEKVNRDEAASLLLGALESGGNETIVLP